MDPARRPLSVLRHALADPLSAAATKLEVLASRLRREAPSLSDRASDAGDDIARAGRLLDLLPALDAIASASPGRLRLADLAGTEATAGVPRAETVLVTARPAAGEAVGHVAAFGRSRGASPRVVVRVVPHRAEVTVAPLGPSPGEPLGRLLLLPPELPEAEALFLAWACAVADGGALVLSTEGGVLAATLSWPLAPEGGA